MKTVIEIFNSEGPLVAVAEQNEKFFLMIRKRNCNDYSYFPLNRALLKQYFDGEITLRELLPSYESFIFIDDYYNNGQNEGMIANDVQVILNYI